MVWIAGEGHEQWLGLIERVDKKEMSVKVYFYIQSSSRRDLYVRETRGVTAYHTVHWNSVIEKALGHWEGENWHLEFRL